MAYNDEEYKFLFKDDNAVYELETGVGVVGGASTKEAILKRLEKGKVDTKETEESIAREKNRVNQLMAKIDPTIQEVCKNNYDLWYTLRKYIESFNKNQAPKLVAILVLKAVKDTYQLSDEDIAKLVESSAQEEIDKLSSDFEKLIAKRDNTFIKIYDEQVEEPVEEFPGNSR